MKAVIRLSISVLVLAALALLCTVRSKPKVSTPFSLEAISSNVPYCADWDSCNLSGHEEAMAALTQPYRYLGSGGQCFAFVSEDDRYVIKFFKQKAFAIPQWIHRFPVPILIQWLKEKKTAKRQERRDKVFKAFKLSKDTLGRETGLLYVHLNRTSHLNKKLSLCDAKGGSYLLNLDDLEFVIQRKAELAFAKIDSLMQNKECEGAKRAIDKLLELSLGLGRKGFRDRDPNLRSNCGFIGDEAILIDVGRIIYSEEIKEPKKFKRELMRASVVFRKYLSRSYPQLLSHFDNCIAKILESDNNKAHEPAI